MAGELHFVTGFPGFIATRLVRALLARDDTLRVVTLVEASMRDRAAGTAASIDAERIEILTGDIGERGLGLPADDHERLVGEMTVAHHLAAIYNLAVPLELAQRVNVDGTGNVLELCARAERLSRLNYVSTAYVAGTRHGVVYEHELVMGQGFKNHYESTKFQAEAWVRELSDRVPVTIYRPAIVVGDSRTGETQKFDGPYYMLRLVSVARRRGMPIPQMGRRDAPFNVVPVDFVVDALLAGAQDPDAAGETLHLVDPEPLSAYEVYRRLAREYAGTDPQYRLPSRMVEHSLRMAITRRMFAGTPRESVRYLNHAVRFDARRASDLLERHGLTRPRFADYVPAVVRFFREHEDDAAYQPA